MTERSFSFSAGPFNFQLNTDVPQLARYIKQHYRHALFTPNQESFIDFHVAVEKGPLYRRLIAPQVIFSTNYTYPFKPLPLDQAHAMMEWGINWVVANSAHQFFIIHAGVLEKDGKAVIISAPPGSGKSTLCAYLASRGWRLLSDELALVDPKSLQTYGLGRPVNLKNQSIDLMKNYFDADHFSAVAKDTHKGTVSLLRAPKQSVLQSSKPAMPCLMLFVRYEPDERCYSEFIAPAKALTELISNTFNFTELNQQGFDVAKRLVNQAPTMYLEYNDFEAAERAISSAMEAQPPCR